MSENKNSRRDFMKNATLGAAGVMIASRASSYANILGANDRVRVGIVGYSDRCRQALIPSFMMHAKELNFDFVAVSDVWSRRRDEGAEGLGKLVGHEIAKARNNEELYDRKDVDAVIIATADFQHALHGAEAVRAGRDAYVEKPMANTMEDAKAIRQAVEETKKIVQIGSQRRSGRNPDWDPRKYLEFRLFWPYSSGIPCQWMSHQIDTVHWFSGLPHPRSVVANGGIYQWHDGRQNFDTMTAVFDYGPLNDMSKGFQVVYSPRFSNSAGGVKELYYSNAGMLNLDTNKITPEGGLRAKEAAEMKLQPNLLAEMSLADATAQTPVATSANTGADNLTSAHMRNWMECIRSRQTPHADVHAGYNHSTAICMTIAALQTGKRVTFDDAKQEVVVG